MMITSISPYIAIFFLNIIAGAVTTFGVGVALDTLSLNLIVVFITILVADTVSDTVYFFIGRLGLHTLADKLLAKRKKARSRFEMVERYYDEHGASTIFLGKMSDILAVPAVLLAGASRMSYGYYIVICTATSILKTIVILLAGYLIGKSTDTADAHFVLYGLGGVFLIVLIIVLSRHFYATIRAQSDR